MTYFNIWGCTNIATSCISLKKTAKRNFLHNIRNKALAIEGPLYFVFFLSFLGTNSTVSWSLSSCPLTWISFSVWFGSSLLSLGLECIYSLEHSPSFCNPGTTPNIAHISIGKCFSLWFWLIEAKIQSATILLPTIYYCFTGTSYRQLLTTNWQFPNHFQPHTYQCLSTVTKNLPTTY